MAKKLFWIVLLLLIAYGAWTFINHLRVKIRYGTLVDASKAIVKYTPNEANEKIIRKLKEKASEAGLELDEEAIELYRDGADLSIYISYADSAVWPFGLRTVYFDQEIDVSKANIEE